MSNETSILQVTSDVATDKRATGRVALVTDSGESVFTSTGLVLSGDTRLYTGAGAPVSYTDGDPAATGEAEAGIGSIYSDTTNGKLYVNGGTKAQPLWKLVTSAA